MDDKQQDRVHHYVAEIMKIASGIPREEGATALTVAVAAFIVVWASDSKGARKAMAHRFLEEVLETLDREDIVDWVKDHTVYAQPATATQN